MSTWQILHGDVRERLRDLEPGSVQCVVTSPPYWGLRDYGHAGQLGLEATPDAFTEAMVGVFAEAWRVLADDGVCWLNLGDSYASGEVGRVDGGMDGRTLGKMQQPRSDRRIAQLGVRPKNLVGIPWRVAFALQAAGWYLRSDIIWSKPNPMPESVTDRPTKAHEYIFLLTKSERYYYDADAIKEPCSIDMQSRAAKGHTRGANGKVDASRGDGDTLRGAHAKAINVDDGRNKRSVWEVPTQAYSEAHFATFPEALVEPCILAGSKEGDLILDPFCGSGTTLAVAVRLQRNAVGIELNPAYIELARKRIGNVAPLLAQEIVA
jgi:DNA modification methylase